MNMKNLVKNRNILCIFSGLLMLLSSLVSSAGAYTFQNGMVILDQTDMSKTDYVTVDHYRIIEIRNQSLEIDRDINFYFNFNESVTVVIPIANETFSFPQEPYEVRAFGTKGELNISSERLNNGKYLVNVKVDNYTIPPMSMIFIEMDSARKTVQSKIGNSVVFEGTTSTASGTWVNFMETSVMLPKKSGMFKVLNVIEVSPIPDSRYDTKDFVEIAWKSDRNRALKTHYVQPFAVRYSYDLNPNIYLGFLVFFSTLFAYLLTDTLSEISGLKNKLVLLTQGRKNLSYFIAFILTIVILIIIAVIGSTL